MAQGPPGSPGRAEINKIIGDVSTMAARAKKDILFLCHLFYPEHHTAANLSFDTARYMASHGFSVDALVGYPWEYTQDRHVPLVETVEGVGIRRIRYLQIDRKRKLGRLINFFSFTFGALLHSAQFRKYRVIVVYSNPPVLPVAAILAKRKYGTKYVFVAHDIYPEVAYASKSLTPKSVVSRLMNWINRRLYRSADCVIAMTDEMKAYLLAHRPQLSADRVVTIENWAHERPATAEPGAYTRFGYKDGQFVVSFFGNMGTCQDVEVIMEAAELLKQDDRVRFLIAGYGNKKDAVEARIRERGLHNVQLMNYLTGEAFEQAMAISACSIVSLERGLMGMCAPSKYYTCLHGGQAILAIVEKGSYLNLEVEKERIGYTVEIGDGRGLRDAILKMAENPAECARMGQRARKLYEERYNYAQAMGKYCAVITDKCGIAKESS